MDKINFTSKSNYQVLMDKGEVKLGVYVGLLKYCKWNS